MVLVPLAPGEAVMSAPICDSGSITRPIGRPDRLASPMKVAVIGWLATSPISRRVEVPLFPMSSASRGCSRSEEHTSELQSLMRISYAVFCLKKKNIHNYNLYLPQLK